ncbi:MAG: hypothetical protein R3B38_02695 [Patescibacteria group bacterium]
MEMQQIGNVVEYFEDISVATISLTQPLAVGEEIWYGTDDEMSSQTVESLEIEKESVDQAEAGAVVATHIHRVVEPGMPIYKKAE